MIKPSKLWVLVLLVSSTFFGLSMVSQKAAGDDFSPETFSADQFIEYERQLNALLKTRRDEEKAFVANVVRQVRLGRIPSKLVSTSYGWVRAKRPDTQYPFIYFEKVLRLQAQAAELESEIPNFDLSVYTSKGQNPFSFRNNAGTRALSSRSAPPSAGQRRIR